MRSWPWIVWSAEFSCSRYITTSPSTTAAVSARPAAAVTRVRTVPETGPAYQPPPAGGLRGHAAGVRGHVASSRMM